jgi:hypothetical protein
LELLTQSSPSPSYAIQALDFCHVPGNIALSPSDRTPPKKSGGDDGENRRARTHKGYQRRRRPSFTGQWSPPVPPHGGKILRPNPRNHVIRRNSMSEQQQEVQRNRIVRIHIDQHRYESPSPTRGEALYLLGNVAPGSDLYREVEGKREDQPVWDDGEEIHLREDEHFHSGPAMKITIIVNGRKKEAPSRMLTFMQVVALAFDPVPSGPEWVFTVTYRKAASKPHEGTLTEGETVTVRNGAIFNVTATNKS